MEKTFFDCNIEYNMRNVIKATAHPNPVADQVTFRFSSPITEELHISFYSMSGHSIMQLDHRCDGSEVKIEGIDFPAGEYLVCINGRACRCTTQISVK
jgi:hypothetical protein